MSTDAVSATVYASRSISWDTTTLPSGATFEGGVIFPDAVMEERHDDDSVITDNPVETGSVINDHAYDLPQDLEIVAVWDSVKQASGQVGFLETMYQKVLDIKQAKILLNVVTGKRSYQNLLLKGISEITDKDSENVLMLRLSFKQVLLTYTTTVSVSSAAQQSIPQKTMPTINNGIVHLGTATNYNAGTTGS
jgi:hypothetical protein